MGEFMQSNLMYALMALATSFVITYIAIPSIIHIAKQKHLYDEPNERKSHTSKIPTLGGVAIFGGFIIALSIWSDMGELPLIQYVLAGCCIIFLVGAKDDIVDLAPRKKFLGQLIATGVIVLLGGLRFTSFHDLFPPFQVPYIIGAIITVFTILVIVNSFNLIDGINALSGSIGIIIAITFGLWFWKNQDYQMVILAASIIGALLAFLRFNVSPASIFMGDTGSLLIGFLSAIMAIRFVESNVAHVGENYFVGAAPAVAISFLGLPLFDLLRAFFLRIIRGKSPFNPDRIHIHHMLLDRGLTHMQATYVLAVVQLLYILIAYFLQSVGLNSWAIITIVLFMSISLSYFVSKRKVVSKAPKLKEVKDVA